MTKTLMGAIAGKAGVETTFQFIAFGARKVAVRADDWPPSVLEAASALIAACDQETPDLDDVVSVQVYTPLTNPTGTAFCDPGDIVDVTFRGGSVTRVRVGDDEVVPLPVAAARDAFKAAVTAAL